jgi:hypothetical protein
MTEIEAALVALGRSLDKMIRIAIREELALVRTPATVPTPQWQNEEAVAARLKVSRAALQSWRYSGKGHRS